MNHNDTERQQSSRQSRYASVPPELRPHALWSQVVLHLGAIAVCGWLLYAGKMSEEWAVGIIAGALGLLAVRAGNKTPPLSMLVTGALAALRSKGIMHVALVGSMLPFLGGCSAIASEAGQRTPLVAYRVIAAWCAQRQQAVIDRPPTTLERDTHDVDKIQRECDAIYGALERALLEGDQ